MTRKYIRRAAAVIESNRLDKMNEAFEERMRAEHPGSEGVVGPDPDARPLRRARLANTDRLWRDSTLA